MNLCQDFVKALCAFVSLFTHIFPVSKDLTVIWVAAFSLFNLMWPVPPLPPPGPINEENFFEWEALIMWVLLISLPEAGCNSLSQLTCAVCCCLVVQWILRPLIQSVPAVVWVSGAAGVQYEYVRKTYKEATPMTLEKSCWAFHIETKNIKVGWYGGN